VAGCRQMGAELQFLRRLWPGVASNRIALALGLALFDLAAIASVGRYRILYRDSLARIDPGLRREANPARQPAGGAVTALDLVADLVQLRPAG
jgi:hypothetical protein